MSGLLHEGRSVRWPSGTQLAGALGAIGATRGVVAGLIELLIGPAIREWVRDKQDTTQLGIATFALAGVALASAFALIHRPTAVAPR